MPIDRERFLRAALLLSLGGAPAAGCIVTDASEDPAAEQTSGGEQQPVMVRQGPAEEGGYAPAYEGAPPPANEGYAPADEGGYAPANEGGPSYE